VRGFGSAPGTDPKGETVHPVFEEILRSNADSVQSHAFKRWQQIIRAELASLVDKAEFLAQENADLKAKLAKAVKRTGSEAA